jgi:glycosyltransferase involved in cell wall biosynthesis
MAITNVVEVSLEETDSERLWGRNIEAPQPGLRSDGHQLDLIGWVVGRLSPAVAVEVVHEDTVVRRAPLNVHRPDIEEAFPEVSGAANSGFRTTVSVTGMGELELEVRAVLRDQSRVPLGVLRTRRRWREEDFGVGAALVSVVIPCHNQAHFLSEAIESVLAQTYPHFEIVVVDDGSTDNTEEVASRYPGVRCIRQENQGLAEARNTGIRRSNGGYLVFLDADDRLLPGALEAGLRCLRDHPESAFVAGRYRYIAFDGSPLPTPLQPLVVEEHYAALLRSCYISTPAAAMWHRMVLEHLGVFDTTVCFSADRDLYLRVAKQYPVHHHGEVVAEYRRPDTSMTYEAASMLESEVTVLRRQRKYARSRERYKEAYNVGIRHSQDSFGKLLIEESLVHLQEQRWRLAISALLVLIRYHPRGFASVLRSKRSRIGV